MLSFTATDARTIQIKLKEPLVYALALLGGTTNGGLVIVPKETDTTFEPKQDMIGTGPFSLANYTQSVGFNFKRNDEYWDKEWAYPDTIEMPIVTEYAAALSQLKAGNIYRFAQNGSDIKAEDVLPLKRDEPRMNVYLGDLGSAGVVGAILAFGWQPIDGKPTPMTDERVRQAMSMAIDRDTYLDTFHNVSNMAKEGIQIDNRWDSHLISSQEGWWLDPKGKDFGPNAKYFKFDLAEAKKLLAAAGFPSGFEAPSNYVTSPELGAHPKSAEVEDGFLRDLGIKVKTNPINYTREYQPNYRDGRGQFMGWGYVAAVGSHGGSAIGRLATEFWSEGGNAFKGFSTTGQNDQKGDPTARRDVHQGPRGAGRQQAQGDRQRHPEVPGQVDVRHPPAGSRCQPHGCLACVGELACLPDGPPQPQALDRHDEGAVQELVIWSATRVNTSRWCIRRLVYLRRSN